VLAIAFLRKHTRWQREGMMLLIAGLSQSMTRNISTLRSIVTRCLAVGVLLCISCVGIVGTSALVASSTTADAPGGGAVAEVAVAERRLSRRWFSRRRLSCRDVRDTAFVG
jgi:hypothetical protein